MSAQSAGHPLIVTAGLPRDLAAWATGLRRRHFPPERNYLDAHVTLFHALPPQCEDEASALLGQFAREFSPVDAKLDRVISLGGGTALAIESDGMLQIRRLIADHFHGLLTAQDQDQPRLHITIQNKVSSAAAKALQGELADIFAPRDFTFHGLELHRYVGGPWKNLGKFAFRGKARA